MSRTGYNGLSQGSVLSPFLYSRLESGIDRFIPAGCVILQYADDVVVQTACFGTNGIFGSQGFFFVMVELTISAMKSEAIVFSRRHHKPDVSLWIDGRRLPQTKEFKYLGVFFDSGLRWNTKVRYVEIRCLERLNFTRSIAGTW
jgi:hypothetical protein